MAIIILGEFVFTQSEVPDYIPFGGQESLAVHQFVGGGRVIDAMGIIEPDITWSGIFMGNQMTRKARYITKIMKEAKPLKFSYNQFRYNVLIKSFEPQYRDTYIEYTITLAVIQNLTEPVLYFPQLTWVDAFKEQLAYAQTLADLIKNGNILDKVGAIAAAVDQVPDLGIAGQGQISNITGLVGDASGAVTSAIGAFV